MRIVVALLMAVASPIGAQGAGKLLTTSETVRIDGVANEFSSIGSVMMGPAGQVAFNTTIRTIPLFSAAGKLETTIGRRGGGPGEFQLVNRLGWIGDTLWVLDNLLRRITFFSSTGKLLRTSPVPTAIQPAPGTASAVYLQPEVIAPLSGGGFAMTAFANPAATPTGPSGRMNLKSKYLRVTADGSVTEVLGDAPVDDCAFRRGDVEARKPFCAPVPQTAAPDGSRITILSVSATGKDSATYRLTSVRTTGDTVFSRVYPVPIVAVTNADRDAFFKVREKEVAEGRLPAANLSFIKSIGTAATYLPVVSLVSGRDGVLWIALRPTADGKMIWRLVDPSGNAVGYVELAIRRRAVAGDRQTLWVIEWNDDDVPSLVRLGIRP